MAAEPIARRISPWIGALLTFSICAVTAMVTLGAELRQLRLMAESNNASDQTLLAEIKERPTKDNMRAQILESMRPFDSAIAQLQVQVQVLQESIRRLEASK